MVNEACFQSRSARYNEVLLCYYAIAFAKYNMKLVKSDLAVHGERSYLCSVLRNLRHIDFSRLDRIMLSGRTTRIELNQDV